MSMAASDVSDAMASAMPANAMPANGVPSHGMPANAIANLVPVMLRAPSGCLGKYGY